jgi:hypothetical protein
MDYRAAWIGGFLAIGLMSLLALPSWAQETLTVTTLVDTADPPFAADDPCGVGTIGDLPGEDGEVSLREAIIAANNTEGTKTIVFDPGLIGKTPMVVGFDTQDTDLALNPLPWLCGGSTTINGDIDGDGLSDITLEGSSLEEGDGLLIISSGNTLIGLTLINFPDFGVVLLPLSETTLTANTLLGNVISGSGLNGVLIQAGFSSAGSPVGHVAQTTIEGNTIQFNGFDGVSVLVVAPPEGSGASITDTTITGNVIVGNGNFGVGVFPFNTRGAVITQVAITSNTMSANKTTGVVIGGGVVKAAGNTVDGVVEGNTITDNGMGEGIAGIYVIGGDRRATNNTVTVEIRNNLVQENIGPGIGVAAGQGNASGNTVVGVIEGNTVVNNVARENIVGGIGLVGGVTFAKGERARQNTLTMEARGNLVQGNTDVGIGVNAGQDGAVDNTVDVIVDGNTLTDDGDFGIQFAGGVNTGQVAATASGNTLTVQATGNQVSGSGVFGFAVFGGFRGLAEGNTVQGTLSGNTVTNSGETGIAFLGGFDNVLGIIAGNVVEGTAVGNTADGIICEDGIERNRASCVLEDNTITE